MSSSSSPVWFITGSSSGLGLSLTLYALRQGHRVIATSRNPSKTPELVTQVEALGGSWLALDVTSDESTLKVVVEKAIAVHGRIDVLVNNAGYSILGAIEDISDAEAHAQFETNFFGPLRLTRLLLPHLRARRAGTILNISSIAGLDAQPACGVYAASKFALEGLSEALAKEVAGLGIDVHVVEPGAFRTRFLSTEVCRTPARGTGEAYEVGPVGRVLRGMREADGRQIGDGDVAARVVFEFVGGEGPVDGDGKKFLRLMLGSDCLRRARIKVDKLDETLRALDGLAQTTDIRE